MDTADPSIGTVLDEVRAVRAAIEGPAGLNVRVALVEAAVKQVSRWPDARWVGGVLGALVLAVLTGAGYLSAQPAQPTDEVRIADTSDTGAASE